MNHHPDPPLKSPFGTAGRTRLAAAPLEHGNSQRLSCRPKAVPPQPTRLAQLPQQGGDVSDTVERPFVGLHIIAPRYATPSATAVCRCGRSRHARGKERVLVLIEAHTAHRDTCTGQPETPETTRSAA